MAGLQMRCLILAMAGAVFAASQVAAQESFYHGKTINFVLSTGNGGGYATYARAVTPYLTKHLSGQPTIVVQSMPGAGGIRATNFLFNQAPRDGTTIGLVHSGIPFAPLFGMKSAQFDGRGFNWIGSMNSASYMCVSWFNSPIKTWDDMLTKEFIVGSSGAGSQMETLPAMLNSLTGTKMKVVAGYKDGIDVLLAIERGELHGRCGSLMGSIRITRPDWLTEKKILVPIVIAAKRMAAFPETPAILEFVKDQRTRQVFELAFAPQDTDRPVLAPPGVPAARVAELRQALEASLKDPAFLEDAKRIRIDIDFVGGEQLATIIANAYAMPPDVVDAAKETMGNAPAE